MTNTETPQQEYDRVDAERSKQGAKCHVFYGQIRQLSHENEVLTRQMSETSLKEKLIIIHSKQLEALDNWYAENVSFKEILERHTKAYERLRDSGALRI